MKLQKSSGSSFDDKTLIEKYLKTGNTEFWGPIYENYKERIFYHCLRIIRNDEDAKDLTIETFIKAFEHLEHFDLKRHFSPWLSQIATNLCIDLIRKRKRIQFTQIDNPLPDKGVKAISEQIEQEEQVGQMRDAIKKLKTSQRRCFCLFYIHEKSYHEIVGITGYSYSKVRSNIQNGRRNVKRIMERL